MEKWHEMLKELLNENMYRKVLSVVERVFCISVEMLNEYLHIWEMLSCTKLLEVVEAQGPVCVISNTHTFVYPLLLSRLKKKDLTLPLFPIILYFTIPPSGYWLYYLANMGINDLYVT